MLLEKYSRRMKKRPTPAERRFKPVLAECCAVLQTGFEPQAVFRNYSAVRGYIVDFFVPLYRVAFEIDGASHYKPEQIADDQIRDAWLNKRNILVIRITNEQTLDTNRCKYIIQRALSGRKKYIREKKSTPKIKAKVISERMENGVKIIELAPINEPKPRKPRTKKPKRKHACRLETPGTFAGSILWK